MPSQPPAHVGPPCHRCNTPLRLLVEGSLVTARCTVCRFARVFTPETSPWAAMAEVAKMAG